MELEVKKVEMWTIIYRVANRYLRKERYLEFVSATATVSVFRRMYPRKDVAETIRISHNLIVEQWKE